MLKISGRSVSISKSYGQNKLALFSLLKNTHLMKIWCDGTLTQIRPYFRKPSIDGAYTAKQWFCVDFHNMLVALLILNDLSAKWANRCSFPSWFFQLLSENEKIDARFLLDFNNFQAKN